MSTEIDWGRLTGPELAELLGELNKATREVSYQSGKWAVGGATSHGYWQASEELAAVTADVCRQLHRIPVAIAKAEATLTWLRRRQRGPVRVPGTE